MKRLIALSIIICMLILMVPSNIAVQATDNAFNTADEILEQRTENSSETTNTITSSKKPPKNKL